MISKSFKTGLVCLASILAVSGSAARAEMISTTGGASCHSVASTAAPDIDNVLNGVRNNSAGPRPVVCSVPRSSDTTGTSPIFYLYVDGQNAAGTCTACTVVIYHFSGELAAWQMFTECGPSTGSAWNHFVAFPSSTPVSAEDYVSVLCTLPGNGAGILYGTTVFQQP